MNWDYNRQAGITIIMTVLCCCCCCCCCYRADECSTLLLKPLAQHGVLVAACGWLAVLQPPQSLQPPEHLQAPVSSEFKCSHWGKDGDHHVTHTQQAAAACLSRCLWKRQRQMQAGRLPFVWPAPSRARPFVLPPR